MSAPAFSSVRPSKHWPPRRPSWAVSRNAKPLSIIAFTSGLVGFKAQALSAEIDTATIAIATAKRGARRCIQQCDIVPIIFCASIPDSVNETAFDESHKDSRNEYAPKDYLPKTVPDSP